MTPPRRSRWRWPIATAALFVIVAAIVQGPAALRAWRRPTLPVVEAGRTDAAAGYGFTTPATSRPALLRVGPPPTPISVMSSCETDETIYLFLFEALADLRVIAVDKASGASKQPVIPGARLAYTPRADRLRPDVLWIPTAQAATLHRVGAGGTRVERVLSLREDSHIFGFDQDESGAIYLGTYPGRRCLRVELDRGAPRVREIVVDLPEVAACRYLHGIFVTDRALYLHYMSPGVLVRHDLTTGTSVVVMRSDAPGLAFTPGRDRLLVEADGARLLIDRRDEPLDAAEPAAGPSYRVRTSRFEGRVEWEGGAADFSLRPRGSGMRVTCLRGLPDGAVYGGTYWNAWLFRIDPAAGLVEGIGDVPGAQGEFFTVGWADGEVVLPHYQGKLYRYDPTRPHATGPDDANPRRVLAVDGAHFGTSCVTDERGRIVYATEPNYHQASGMLVVVRPDGGHDVFPTIGDGLTLGPLVPQGDTVLAGTIARTGMGRAGKAEERPPQIVRVDTATGAILHATALVEEEPGNDVRGLVALAPDRLVAATKRRLYVVEASSGGLRATPVPSFEPLARGEAGRTVAIVRHSEEVVIVLSEHRLSACAPSSGTVAVLRRVPDGLRFMTPDTAGNLWLADDGTLFCLRAGALATLLAEAGLD